MNSKFDIAVSSASKSELSNWKNKFDIAVSSASKSELSNWKKCRNQVWKRHLQNKK